MGRKTQAANSVAKLNEATAEATRILTDALAAYGTLLQTYVHDAAEAGEYEDCQCLLKTARGLVKPMARLSEALAHVKGERRQTISVERSSGGGENAPKSTEIAPESAPNKIARGDEKPNDSLENSSAPSPKQGGGG